MAAALPEAVRKISDKTPIGSILRSAEWEMVPLALRDRAFFSAGVESARFLGTAQNKLKGAIALQKEKVKRGEAFIDRSSFIADMRKIAQEEGIFVDPLKKGGLQDITSRKRLGLIFDIQTQQAQGFARWKAEQDSDVLDAFPAQELLRLESRTFPRMWVRRWSEAGGKFYNGRMIALKSDPIWRRISRFGTPYPPFDFYSGMGIDDIDREEAEQLGLIAPGVIPTPGEADFNDELQASVRGLAPEFKNALKALFKDQINIDGDVVHWVGQKPLPKPAPTPAPESIPAAPAEPETYTQLVAALSEIRVQEVAIAEEIKAEMKKPDRDLDRLMALSHKRVELTESARNAVSLPVAQRGKITFANTVPKAIRQIIDNGASITARYVSPAYLPKNITVKKISGRAHYNRGMIALAPHNTASVVAHELVHDIEPNHPEVAAATKAFLNLRAEGKKARPLRDITGLGYRVDEVAFEDQWVARGGSPYAGKLYAGPYTELLTMGIERLHESPSAFFAQDPGYFEFVVKTLRKW